MTHLFQKKICFISHNASKTGAPIVLYNFINWLKLQGLSKIYIYFIEGGELETKFGQLISFKNILNKEGIICKKLRKILIFFFRKDLLFNQEIKNLKKFDLLFFNTVASLKYIDSFQEGFSGNSVLWIHENPFSINCWYNNYMNSKTLSYFKHIYCVSNETLNWLIEEWKVPSYKLHLVYPFILKPSFLKQPFISNHSSSLLFTVGGCGIQDWRKGPDLFLQIAHIFKTKYPFLHIRFIWVGPVSSMSAYIDYEIAKMQLQDTVQFLGTLNDTTPFFNEIDLFLLTSREDPFPLVVLEALANDLPVICFDGIGDITKVISLIEDNVVPYGRIDLLVERILFYYNSKLKNESNLNIFRKQAEPFYLNDGTKKLVNLIESLWY